MRRVTGLVLIAYVLILLTQSSTIAAPQSQSGLGPHIYEGPSVTHTARSTTSASVTPRTTNEPGKECSLITFEGIGDVSPVPTFDNIELPGWLGIIDSDAGGQGNFANEPSPSTIAFWLYGNASSQDINFASPVAEVSFRYSSYVGVALQAFAEDGSQVDYASGAANWNQGTGDPNGTFNVWTPLAVQSEGNSIKKVRIFGNVNQTGIDDLKVCTKIGIDRVEFTQAIQELQTLDDLKADLQDNGEPPVPIIANKPLALRVYMREVRSSTTVRVKLSGVANAEQTVQLPPNCSVDQARRQEGGCRSIDFFFTPPSGSWTATLQSYDQAGNEIERHDLSLTSVATNPITLRAVKVCDSKFFFFFWNCSDPTKVSSLVSFLERTAPTYRINVINTSHTVRRNTSDYTDNMSQWWYDIAQDIQALGNNPYYYGMVRSSVAGSIGGIAAAIPGRGAASRESVTRLGREVADETLAHEVGHLLGRRHTNTNVPTATGGSPPGCYSTASDSSTDWPYSDNRIRSGPTNNSRIEVGFDVANRRVLDGQNHYDWMSYCIPRWISPHTYRNALNTTRSSSQVASLATETTGTFWQISGVISGNQVAFRPLFTYETTGPTGEGTGTFRLEARSSSGTVLFTRQFEPTAWHTESGDPGDDVEALVFAERVPVQLGAMALVVLDPNGVILGTIALGGTPPSVSITAPSGGQTLAGLQSLRWAVSDADSQQHVARVLYSPDDGTTWHTLVASLSDTELIADFDELPGSDTALVRVLVSDGVNTGVSTVGPIRVPRKAPIAQVLSPEPDTIVGGSSTVFLRGEAFDPDTELLADSAFSWLSNRDGPLGVGRQLTTNLSEGIHTLTLQVTDPDGASATSNVTIAVDITAPTLNLTVTPDGQPAQCVAVDLSATDNAGGSGLGKVEYSFNGGTQWEQAYPEALPLHFTVPGSGFIHLVARVEDKGGNWAVSDSRFFIDTACPNQTPVANAGDGYTGLEGDPIALDGSLSIDSDGTLILYEWDLDNDGAFDDAFGPRVTAVFPDNRDYAVTLRVTDDKYGRATSPVTVTVANAPPHVEAGAPITVSLGTIVRLTQARVSDPGVGDTLSATVDWGDGITDSVGEVMDGSIQVAHRYTNPGTYTATVCVRDDDDASTCDTVSIMVQQSQFLVYLPQVRR